VVPQSAISGMTVTVTSTGQKVSKTITSNDQNLWMVLGWVT